MKKILYILFISIITFSCGNNNDSDKSSYNKTKTFTQTLTDNTIHKIDDIKNGTNNDTSYYYIMYEIGGKGDEFNQYVYNSTNILRHNDLIKITFDKPITSTILSMIHKSHPEYAYVGIFIIRPISSHDYYNILKLEKEYKIK